MCVVQEATNKNNDFYVVKIAEPAEKLNTQVKYFLFVI